MSSTQRDRDAQGGLAERYAAGHMGAAEEQEFETLMLEQPELLADVRAAQGLRTGFARVQREGELQKLLRRRPMTPRLYALAAGCVALVVGAGVLLTRLGDGSAVMAASVADLHLRYAGPSTIAATYLLTSTRSPGHPTTIAIPAQPGVIVLRILPEVPSPAWHVTLARRENEQSALTPVGQLDTAADPSGFLQIYLDPTRLGPGEFRVSIEKGEHRERFEIRLEPAAHP